MPDLRGTLEGHTYPVNSVTFSHDSMLVATASYDRTVKVWDASNKQCVQTLDAYSDRVHSVVFSYDYKPLASASGDNTVKVWDASNAQCLRTLNVGGVAFLKSFDSTYSYLETDSGTLHLSFVSDTGRTTTNPEIPQLRGFGVSSDRAWITWNSKNLLRLPPDCRQSKCAVASP